MLRLTISVLIILLFSCNQKSLRADQTILDRIEYIYNLKVLLNDSVWKGFASLAFDVPLIYYTDTNCYVANPTSKFLTIYKPQLVYENKQLKIYKTNHLIDSIPFHMETGILFGDSTGDYNYKSPFMQCSSPEITRRTIQEVNTTEQWATMVIHEYFHGFQYQHPAYLDYLVKNIFLRPEDTLKKIYKSYQWFQEDIDKENEMLLKAIHSADSEATATYIDTFFMFRDQRHAKAKEQFHFDIKKIEDAYETMEGTARYVEYSLYQIFAVKQPEKKLLQADSSYQSYQYFKNLKLENETWLYLPNKTIYFYATGFNMARLLDKLKVSYKTRLFNERGLSLEQLLRHQYGR